MILDIISISALVLVMLLHTINYHYNKGPLKVEFIKCKRIHSGLLRIIVLLEILLQWDIKFHLIYIIARYTYGGIFAAIVHWFITISLFCNVYIKQSWHIDFLTNIESILLWYFWTQHFEAVKETYKIQF